MKVCGLSSDELVHLLQTVRAAFDAGEITGVSVSCGVCRVTRSGQQFVEYEPTNGRTITIEINGGAVERTEEAA